MNHQIVVAEIKFSLHTNKKACKVRRYDWSKLNDNKDIQSQYSIAVKYKFIPLIANEDGKQIDHKLGLPADHIYNALAKVHIDAAEETILRKQHKKDTLWEKAKVISAQEHFKLAQKLSKKIQTKEMSSAWKAIKLICM